MLLHQYFRKELQQSLSAVFVTLFILITSITLARILGQASKGQVSSQDVMVIVGLTGLSALPTVLSLSLFISVMIVLMRWYKDSEMVVWRTSGISLLHLATPLLRFVIPVAILVFSATMWLRPWGYEQITILKHIFTNSNGLHLLTPGAFQTLKGQSVTIFVGQVDAQTNTIRDIFISDQSTDNILITTAAQGIVQQNADGITSISLEKGRHYHERASTGDIGVLNFNQYVLTAQQKIANKESLSIKGSRPDRLWALHTPAALAELSWRLNLPILTILAAFSALGLAFQGTRQANSRPIVLSIFVVILYNTMISFAENQVRKQGWSFWVAITLPHLLYFMFTWLLIRYRNYGRLGFH